MPFGPIELTCIRVILPLHQFDKVMADFILELNKSIYIYSVRLISNGHKEFIQLPNSPRRRKCHRCNRINRIDAIYCSWCGCEQPPISEQDKHDKYRDEVRISFQMRQEWTLQIQESYDALLNSDYHRKETGFFLYYPADKRSEFMLTMDSESEAISPGVANVSPETKQVESLPEFQGKRCPKCQSLMHHTRLAGYVCTRGCK